MVSDVDAGGATVDRVSGHAFISVIAAGSTRKMTRPSRSGRPARRATARPISTQPHDDPYPAVYQGIDESSMPGCDNEPRLSYRDDNPGRSLPAFHLSFEVTG